MGGYQWHGQVSNPRQALAARLLLTVGLIVGGAFELKSSSNASPEKSGEGIIELLRDLLGGS